MELMLKFKFSNKLIGAIFVLIFSVQSCCSTRLFKSCGIDEAEVKTCIQNMKSNNYQDGTAEKSALDNLIIQYKKFKNGDISCNKFTVFYNGHLANYCN